LHGYGCAGLQDAVGLLVDLVGDEFAKGRMIELEQRIVLVLYTFTYQLEPAEGERAYLGDGGILVLKLGEDVQNETLHLPCQI
jgi:hypothetical protein